jgi:CBS domain-containing protein
MNSNKNNPVPEEFVDPLQNYEPRTYHNSLEQALSEEPVAAIQSRPFTSISPNASISEAIQLLASRHVSCALVEEDGKLVGIFTDRDLLNKVALERELLCHPVHEVMTKNPVFIHDTDSSAAALCVMAVVGHRHVPVLDSNRQIVGIVTPQRITSFLLSHADA